jgi:hypothetical protein
VSRFGNGRPPGGDGEPDVLHGWGLIDARLPAMVLFSALEERLEDLAQARAAVLLGAPTYETYRLGDPAVPADVHAVAAVIEPIGPLWAVHAWAHFRARTLPAAAREVADRYGVPAADPSAAYLGGGP